MTPADLKTAAQIDHAVFGMEFTVGILEWLADALD
ncbi:hypothetical protein SDC9_192938 [bioreactor metagenome]|uniref:Uncharacterized protein n=1 Tax=bioreactor metagenome TaxID=1076179 RepID=A0A645I245_9ZZZZ